MSGNGGDRTRIDRVLDFWLGTARAHPTEIGAQLSRWFSADEDRDEKIRSRFAADVEAASAGRLDPWAASPQGRLALIVLLDQFRRNLYRGRAEAFACDPKALSLCLDGLESQAGLTPAERLFLLMPLQHAESVGMQEISVREFARLCEEAGAAWREPMRKALDSARAHCGIVARFGRFPHRNRTLGRPGTAEERAWLDAGGETFDQ